MKPSRRVVQSIVRSWGLHAEWLEDEWECLTKSLVFLSECNGGRVLLDAPLSQRDFNRHFRRTCGQAIARAMRQRARQMASVPVIPYRLVDSTRPVPCLPLLKARKPRPRIDINRVSRRKLLECGLTDEEARAVLAARRTVKGFTQLAAVQELVSKEGWSRLKEQIYVDQETPVWKALSRIQRLFVRYPTLKNYLCMVLPAGSGSPSERKAALFSILNATINEIRETSDMRTRRIVTASEIIRAGKIEQKAREAARCSARDITGVTLLDGSQYLRFLKMVLAQATRTVRVMMFFMAHRPEGKHPLVPILEELRAAKERGVDVRVILDKDSPPDVYGSRRINRSAYRFLVDHGIPVVFSVANKVIHSKVVVIDSCHVLLGSHNWTLGSMFRYDEKSVYLESAKLGEQIEDRFQQLWENPQKQGDFRAALLTAIDPAAARVRNVGLYSVDDLLHRTGSEMPADQVASLEREVRLQDLESRMKNMAGTFPRRIDGLTRSVGKIPGRARALIVIPADAGGYTLFYLTDQSGQRERLPFRLRPKADALIKAWIVNRTRARQSYVLSVQIGQEPSASHCFSLESGEQVGHEAAFKGPDEGCKRIINLTLTPDSHSARRAGQLYVVVTGDAGRRHRGRS